MRTNCASNLHFWEVAQKGSGTRDTLPLEGTWYKAYPTPSPDEQTDACENIFPLRSVIKKRV